MASRRLRLCWRCAMHQTSPVLARRDRQASERVILSCHPSISVPGGTMKRVQRKLSFSNVVALLALFVALGGSAYAATQLPKNSVGPKQLKKNAVTTAKIAKGAVTGAKVNLSFLGTVPNATHAASADTAKTAAPGG